MKIYTRTGDSGETGFIGGRVKKDDSRVEAYGTVDELNSFLGQAISLMDEDRYVDMREDLQTIQHELFDCGTDLALLKEGALSYKVTEEMVGRLEQWIDNYDAETAEITRFVLPGGGKISSALHVCRTICRRAERRVVTLASLHSINRNVIRYLNRLSDLLFTLARAANSRDAVPDVEYVRSSDVHRRK